MPLQTSGAHEGDPLTPALIALHVPTEPTMLHASHAPVHAALQQTPSAKKLELH